MNTRLSKLTIQTLLGCSVLAMAMPAMADSTWSDLPSTCSGTTVSMNCGNGTGGPSLTASAVYDVTATSGVAFAAAKLYNWSSGLGVVSGTENSGTTGPHATDNVVNTDAVQLNFGTTAVNLTSLTIGWNGTDNRTDSNGNSSTSSTAAYRDSDISVLAWMGTSAPTATSTMGVNGWKLVGSYADVGAIGGLNPNKQVATQDTTTYSSYWLISAYSSAFGFTGTGLDNLNDAFKLKGISVSTKPGTSVPEPGSIALIGAGLLGLFVRARRKQAKSI
jgi:hypothetical protein